MIKLREIRKIMKSKPTIEGAGVHLKRAFGYHQVPQLDPFLLLDDFHSKDPRDYILGFPWHPHRGIETVTYMLHGKLEHGDSIGNKGVIETGDVQWMSAGSGIVHQEMPKQFQGLMWGFQLWINLPASRKMGLPRYQEIKSEQIPEVSAAPGTKIRVICGTVKGVKGPVSDMEVDPEYLDIGMEPDTEFVHQIKSGYTVFAYVIDGKGFFDTNRTGMIEKENLVLFGDGDQLKIETGKNSLRFLLISGKPLEEPVAWYGPIVMNTQEELNTAFEEYRNGTFLKHP